MSEWWTYRLSDFLMFSPRTYWRLAELYNEAWWPGQLAALAIGLLLLGLVAIPRSGSTRVVAALLAIAWAWVAWAFHWQRYATINLAAPYFALAFGLEALLFVLAAFGSAAGVRRATGVRILGWLLAISGVLFYPMAGLPAGRPWSQVEVFGFMPEPTALATLGLLLAGGQRRSAILAVIPVLSLLAGMATLWLLAH
jgi:hypothetical protein